MRVLTLLKLLGTALAASHFWSAWRHRSQGGHGWLTLNPVNPVIKTPPQLQCMR